MSFIHNFQFHFHDKQIQSILHEKKYDAALTHINKITNKKIYTQLSFKYLPTIIQSINDESLEYKIVWINSFSRKEGSYLIKFLEFYLSHFPGFEQDIKTYQEEIADILDSPQSVDLNSLVNLSYAYQWMITQKNKLRYKFIFNHWPFFSTQNDFNFTNSNLTQSYLTLIDSPYEVYKRIKTEFQDDLIVSRNKFLNLDGVVEDEKIRNINFKVSNKGWAAHTLSWFDVNVVNSLKGKIVHNKNLFNETFDTLSSIILHFIQSGVGLEINYQLIEEFIKLNPLEKQESVELSNKEIKFLNNHVENIINEYDL